MEDDSATNMDQHNALNSDVVTDSKRKRKRKCTYQQHTNDGDGI